MGVLRELGFLGELRLLRELRELRLLRELGRQSNQSSLPLGRVGWGYPTVPSSDTLNSFCASTANSIGSLLSTSLA